jgi:hypothetical protein
MKERPKKTRAGALVLVAVGALIPAFGAGVLVGRGMPSPRAPGAATSPEPVADPGVIRELQICQQELAMPPTAQLALPKAAAPPEEARRDAPATAAEVKALERDVKECEKGVVLAHAEVCGAVGHQLELMDKLTTLNRISCYSKAKVGAYIKENFKNCAALGDAPPNLDNLTKEEADKVAQALNVYKTIDEARIDEHIKKIYRACIEKFPEDDR